MMAIELNGGFLKRLITISIALCILFQIIILPSHAEATSNDSSNNSLHSSGQSSISPRQAADQIDKLTKQILLKEIELQRFSILYTLEVAKQGRWKGWRYAFFQEANGATGLAGGIISTYNRGSNLHTPKNVKLYPQEAANYIPMIGSIIGASAAALEFSINGYHDLTASVHGYSPGKAIRHVSEIKHEIDSLMDQRQKLIQIESTEPSLSGRLSVDNAEGKVLQDMLDQSLQEFSRYHVNARKLLTFQQLQYLFDIAKYTTNAIGCDFAFKSLDRRQRLWNGKAGVFFVISGQLTMIAPILSRLAAKGVGRYTKYRLRSVLHDSEDAQIAVLQNDLQALEKLRAREPVSEQFLASLADRQAIFESHEKNFSKGIVAQEKKNDAAKLTATQNILAGAFVGGSKTACGILFLIPGFNPNYNRNDSRSTRVTNDLLFTSAVVGLPATSFAMLDTLRIQVKGELSRAKASKAGALPGQIAANRLKELEQIEKRLKAM